MQMRDEYEIRKLNPRRNPYAKETKKQISIKIDQNVIDYFKELSSNNGIPYQTLINMYLSDCVINKKKPDLSWK
jgi:predicted DNA binding CopG/RHH family protein